MTSRPGDGGVWYGVTRGQFDDAIDARRAARVDRHSVLPVLIRGRGGQQEDAVAPIQRAIQVL